MERHKKHLKIDIERNDIKMKIIESKYISSEDLIGRKVINGVNFLDSSWVDFVLRVADTNKMTDWFNKIGIQYRNIVVDGDMVYYTLPESDRKLSLSKLSSGERYILYLLAAKEQHIPIIASGLFERLGSRLTEVVYKHLSDYDELVVVLFNCFVPEYLEQYLDRRVV